jgi:A/G-specific adenine glycosylase
MRSFPFLEFLHWSKIYGRHNLPWRQYFSLSAKDLSYYIWLSEILLQQTQVERVIGYYANILEYFPTIESLANASYEDFFPHYQGLGYYSRARNILKTAKIITENYNGIFPNNTLELLKLPGVGPYTAAAIRAFVYDEKVLSFDTNLEKIFARYYHGSRFLKLSGEEKILIEKDFQKIGISGREINAAFMDFGSLISLNTKPSTEYEWQQI